MRTITYSEAIHESIDYNMEKDETVFNLGEDIGVLGGGFRATHDLYEKYGRKRVLDTPLSEIAIVGAAIGAALGGLRPIPEIMYIDFTPGCMDMIVNQMAKIHFMFGGQIKVPMVLRTVCGAAGYNAAQHSQSMYPFFVHTPGLIVVTPSTPYDAKGLLNTSIADDNPVIFMEHKRLYTSKGEVPEEFYTIPFGKADVKREGDDLTIVATHALVHDALALAEEMEKEGTSIEVIDPRTLVPFDKETIFKSVEKTNKLIVADESILSCGMASEISAIVAEEMFDYLDKPIIRVASPNCHCPFSMPLEDAYIPGKEELKEAIAKVL
ncbi:MAG: alpha-ketoacid dehydrogenase subunit beta [Spirochaetota bacterium]|nr:MAG: alpha-ketoacid dehydrogenase subunit beta [Spirochaetota bacterium]